MSLVAAALPLLSALTAAFMIRRAVNLAAYVEAAGQADHFADDRMNQIILTSASPILQPATYTSLPQT